MDSPLIQLINRLTSHQQRMLSFTIQRILECDRAIALYSRANDRTDVPPCDVEYLRVGRHRLWALACSILSREIDGPKFKAEIAAIVDYVEQEFQSCH
jgi:hypothetical protein